MKKSGKKQIRITIYNHKGGVGKTTLSVNIAAALAEMGYSVLLVDSDPQCNLTAYLLPDDVVDDLLDKSGEAGGQTIWTSLKPVADRVGTVESIKPIEIEKLDLLPGDIRLSEYEEFLTEAWTDAFRRRLGGFRGLTAISKLVSNISSLKNYDFVFYDTGPNIGPLNRILLLDSDYFIIPVACDLFSVRALSTLGQSLKSWILEWETISSLAPEGADLLLGRPKFLGYIPQQFKEYGRTMASEPARYLRRIKKHIFENISSVLRDVDKELAPSGSEDPMLGQIKNFGSLVQSAQRDGVPLWKCSSNNEQMKLDARIAFVRTAKLIEAVRNR